MHKVNYAVAGMRLTIKENPAFFKGIREKFCLYKEPSCKQPDSSIMNDTRHQMLWDLLGKKLAGEAGKEELEELQQLRDNLPEISGNIEMIENFWNSGVDKTEFEERETALEKHLLRMHEEGLLKNDHESKSRFAFLFSRASKVRLAVVAAAAAVIVIVSIKAASLMGSGQEGVTYKTLHASNGSKNHFILPDGSKVWLNAGTTLKYPVTIDKDSIREVFLSGEAFFEIRHDEKHPFWIRTKQMDILDIGTQFNVKAYPSDLTAETTLIEGSIEVKINDLGHTEILAAPNEKITVFNKEETFTVSRKPAVEPDSDKIATPVPSFTITKVVPAVDSLVAETAWMKDVLVFQNKSFRELAVLMERWYDVTITFDADKLGEYRFTGAFADETIEQALDQLKLVRLFHYSITDRKVMIKEKDK